MLNVLFCLFIFLNLSHRQYGVLSSSSSFTDDELVALKTFRNVIEKDLSPDYMKRDHFLAPWLKARRWNVEDASHALKQHLKWRKENRMDTILEDLPAGKCAPIYPIQTDSVSRHRLPVATIRVRDMDVRRVMISGKARQWNLCVYRFMEEMRTSILAQNERFGKDNITGFIFVSDVEGFNYRQHACVLCINAYVNVVAAFEANYPGMLGKAYLVNMAAIAQTVLEAIKSVMSETTRNSIGVYGFNRADWQQALLKEIAPDQLPPELGGIKGRPQAKNES